MSEETPAGDSTLTRALRHRVATSDEAAPSVTPLYQNSAFEAQSSYFYTRKSNPNSVELEGVASLLEGSRYAVAVTTGMTALALTLDLLRQGDVLAVNKYIYGCSLKLFQRVCSRRGVELVVLDLSTPEGRDSLPCGVSMVLFETPTNPFVRTVPIRDVVAKAREANPESLVVVDNSWATPLFQRPLEHGADISLHSATKYFSGHSDVMGGLILTDREDLDTFFREERFYTGSILDPHSAWLLRRSVQTLSLRMRAHEKAAKSLAEYVEGLPQIERVYYPEVDGEQLTGYGGIIFVELKDSLEEKSSLLLERLALFGTGTAMACVTSMVAIPYWGSHASLSEEEKQEMGIGKNLVRLCVGLEDLDDLKRDLTSALASLEAG
ncbi:trans-sulfuration enzyme family protein [Elusimicrobiota bacterium]